MEEYVLGVVMAELGTVPVPNDSAWLNAYGIGRWADEAVKAQSIAARTYGSYHAHQYPPPNGIGIANSTSYQGWRPYYQAFPEAIKTKYRDLIALYRGQYLAYSAYDSTQRYKYSLIDSMYASDNQRPNTISLWASNGYGYFPTVVNPNGAYVSGPNRGMPQFGSHGMAVLGVANGKQAATFWQILSHFILGHNF